MVGDQEVQIPDFNLKITPFSWDPLLWLAQEFILLVQMKSVLHVLLESSRGSVWVKLEISAPIEIVDTPKVTEVKRIEIGFRTLKNGQYRTVEKESLMLTEMKTL